MNDYSHGKKKPVRGGHKPYNSDFQSDLLRQLLQCEQNIRGTNNNNTQQTQQTQQTVNSLVNTEELSPFYVHSRASSTTAATNTDVCINKPGLSFYMKKEHTQCDYCGANTTCALLPFTLGTFTRFCVTCFKTWLSI